MKNLTWQNPEQLFVAQELINKVKSKCCGIKDYFKLGDKVVTTTGEKIYNGVWSISISTTDNTAEIKNLNDFIVSFNHQGNTKLIASYKNLLPFAVKWGALI